MNNPKTTNWNIEIIKGPWKTFYVCYRSADWEHPGVISCFDTKEFARREDAVKRCRELNASLVSGWMADCHPQNW